RDATVTGVQTCALPIYERSVVGACDCRCGRGEDANSHCSVCIVRERELTNCSGVRTGGLCKGWHRPVGWGASIECHGSVVTEGRSEERRVEEGCRCGVG